MLTRQQFIRFIAIAALSAAPALVGLAQPMLINPALAGSPVEPGAPPAPTVNDKRAQNAEHLRIAMRRLDANGGSDTAAAQEVAFLQTREAVLAQQASVEQQIKDLETRRIELEGQISAPPADKKLYKFADLDRLKDDVAGEEARATLLSDKLANAKLSLEKASAALEAAEVKRRQAQSAAESGKAEPNAVELAAAAERARLESGLASEMLALRKREVEREELTKKVLGLAIRLRQDQIDRISPQVAFTEADFQEQIDGLKKSEESSTASLAQAQANLSSAETELANAKKKLESASEVESPVLTENVAALWRAREKYAEEIDSLTQRLQRYTQLRVAWQRRYKIATANHDDNDQEAWAELKNAQKDTKRILDDLTSDLRMQILKMRVARSSLTSTTKKADATAQTSPEVAMQITLQQKQLEETLRIYEKNLLLIDNSRRVHEKLLDEINSKVEVVSASAIAMGVWYQVDTAWNSELIAIGGQSVKVGDAFKGLAILIIGWILSRSTSGIFANRLLKRFRLSKDATSAIRSLVFYSLLMFVTLTAFNTVGVPMTAFTILGGGLAIGVGFGSQTLINNFIGGLIMLAERPVRLGERVTFGSVDGVVEEVGFRCTKLRTQTDHLVTIPNSALVNESIENIDRRRTIRRSFTISVTYNISRGLLAQGVQAIRDILEEREIRERIHPIVGFEELSPRVHFTDFAAESLTIQITYWYAPVDSSAFLEHSERVNFRIMEEFDRLGIDFAFPSKTPYVKNLKAGSRGRGNDSYAA